MKRILLLIIITIFPFLAFAQSNISLFDAIKERLVTMGAVTTAGKYTGRSVKLTITNNSKRTLDIKINTGIILRPENPIYQQLVLPGGENLVLGAHQTDNLDVEVFCDNAIKECPTIGLHYFYFRICGEELEKVLEYVREHALFDHIGQAAVWSISNYLSLNCVYDSSMGVESEKLISDIVAVTRREKPTYYITYSDYVVPGQRAYMGKADKIYVPFEIILTESKILTLAVYDIKGQWIKNIADPQLYETGKNKILANIVPGDYEKGKYFVRVISGGNVLHEKEITVEPWIVFGS